MNFDHVNNVSDYFRNKLAPHLFHRMQVADFANYLSKMSDAPSCKWMRQELKAFPVNYFVDPVLFADKYSKKCVSFVGTTNPQDGAINVIYQISPTMHVLARLYHWVEHEKVNAYFMLTCAYRDYDDFLKFFDDNKSLRLIGNTEERVAGFNVGSTASSGIDNLMLGFSNRAKEASGPS